MRRKSPGTVRVRPVAYSRKSPTRKSPRKSPTRKSPRKSPERCVKIGKICNPKTNRCVLLTGRVGRKILIDKISFLG